MRRGDERTRVLNGVQSSLGYRDVSPVLGEAQALLVPDAEHQHHTPQGAVQRLLVSVKGTVLWAVVKGIRRRYRQMADLTKKLCCMAFVSDVGALPFSCALCATHASPSCALTTIAIAPPPSNDVAPAGLHLPLHVFKHGV